MEIKQKQSKEVKKTRGKSKIERGKERQEVGSIKIVTNRQ